MSDDVIVRRAEIGELDMVGELTLRAYLADGMVRLGSSYAAELADAAVRHREAELLVVAGPDARLLGTVTVCLPGSPLAEISRPGELEFRMLGVAPEARRRGIGAALVNAVRYRAAELCAQRVVLCSAEQMRAAHRLYARLGFDRLPERDWYPVPGFKLLAFESASTWSPDCRTHRTGAQDTPDRGAGHTGQGRRTRRVGLAA